MKEKLTIEIFLFHYLTTYIRYMMGMKELVRCYFLAISIRSYYFSKTSITQIMQKKYISKTLITVAWHPTKG